MTPNQQQSNIPDQNTTSVNPYLNNHELNYTIDKARRNYNELSLRYNITDWDDLLKHPLPVENENEFIEVSPNSHTTYDAPSMEAPISSSNDELPNLSQGLMNTTLANLKPIQSQNSEEISYSHSSSPEVLSMIETQKTSESTVEKSIENVIEKAPEKYRPIEVSQKLKPKESEYNDKKLSAAVISSMIGKFNVYGYAPSAAILNKLIRSKNPQTAWKIFPPKNAKAWLYALAGRLIAIQNSKVDKD